MIEKLFRCEKCEMPNIDALYSLRKNFNDKDVWYCIKCYEAKHGAWKAKKELKDESQISRRS